MRSELPAGPVKWSGHEALGRYLLGLHRNVDWILRRVETVQLLDTERIQRSTTLDIDCVALAECARAAGVSLESDDAGSVVLPIPLVILPKTLLLDIDVRDGQGQVVPVAVSDRDSAAAQLMMLARVKESGVDPETLNLNVQQKFYDIAAQMPSEEDRQAIVGESLGDVTVDLWSLRPGLGISSEQVELYYTLFDDPELVDLALTFSVQYQLMVPVRVGSDSTAVLKFRHVEIVAKELIPSRKSRWGLESFGFLIDAPAISRAAREHFRVLAPPGTRLASVSLVTFSEGAQGGPRTPSLSSTDYQTRTASDRAIVYTRRVIPGDYTALISLRPQRGGFVRPSLIALAGCFVLLAGGAVAQQFTGVLTRKDSNVEAAVAILAIFPSIMSAYIVREGEHPIVRKLLFYPRLAVLASAGCTLLASGAVVVGLSSSWVLWLWTLFAIVTAGTMTLLIAIDSGAGAAEDSVLAEADRTQTRTVPRF